MIKIGDTVSYRLYNSVAHKFYDEYKQGKVEDIQIRKANFDQIPVKAKMYYVTPSDMKSQPIWLHRVEIKRILKKS